MSRVLRLAAASLAAVLVVAPAAESVASVDAAHRPTPVGEIGSGTPASSTLALAAEVATGRPNGSFAAGARQAGRGLRRLAERAAAKGTADAPLGAPRGGRVGGAIQLAQAPAVQAPRPAAQPDKVLEAFTFIPSIRQSIQFRLQGGRLVADGPATGSSLQQKSNSGGRTEVRNITYAFDGPIVSYEYSAPGGRLTFTTRRRGEFSLEREPAEGAELPALKFMQGRDEGIKLVVGTGDQRRTASGSSIWQLWLAEPDLCRDHLLPLFVQLDPSWNLNDQAQRIEAVLLRSAAVAQGRRNDRFAGLVEELGHESYAVRTAADRELRKAGRDAVDYLLTLRSSELDPEQGRRVRRIIAAASASSENDAPERVAARLMDDPLIWLTLLRRDDPNVRRVAHGQLDRLVGPVKFPVEGSPEERKTAWDELAEYVRGRVAEARP